METMTETGTDKRVDELSKRVDRGFEEVDGRLARVEADIREFRLESNGRSDRLDDKIDAESAALRAEMKAGFDGIDARFDAMDRKFDKKFDAMEGKFNAMDAKIDAKFDSFHRTVILLLGGALSTLVGGLIAAAFTALS
jgi:hypothetical protein